MDGPDVRRALKFRMAMQADIGMPEDRVRLLTRAEAGALASEVQSAAVEDRAAKVAEVENIYGPLFGRAMKELSQAGLDPRFQVLAVARDTPVLARAIAQVIGTEHAELEKGLDGPAVKDLRRRLSDATAEAASAAPPGGETAESIEAIRSAAEDLGVQFFRQTGRKDESIRRAAAFANGAIEEIRLSGSDEEDVIGPGEGDELAGGAGGDTLTGDDEAVDAGDDGDKGTGGDEPDSGGVGDDTADDIVIKDTTDGGVRLSDPATGAAKEVSPEQIGELAALAGDVDGIAILDEGGAASLSANLPDPDAAPDELRQEIRELLLSILPITGEALSARDAYIAMLAARDALKRGDLSEASIQGALVALGVVGTVPVFGRLVTGVRVLVKLLGRQRRRAVETAAAAARAASPRWFARWTDNILSGKVKPQGKAARVGKTSLKVKTFLKTKGIDAGTTAIHVIDKRIWRMNRPTKVASKRLPVDIIRRMPEKLTKPKAVLWDKKDPALLYVFDNEQGVGKFVIKVEFFQDVQRGDKLVRRKGNFVHSGGQIDDPSTLKAPSLFELVEGAL